jgi:hypothetical protein
MATGAGSTGLEVAKLAVEALTPVAVVAVGYVLNRRLRQVEQIQWANQTVISRRVEIFTEVAPKLNRLLCFAAFVGRWKEITPAQAIALKRELDETMFANRVLFSDHLFAAYQAFMRTLFAMYASTDADAPLRVPVATALGDRRNLPWWEDTTPSYFATTSPATLDEVHHTYEVLGQRFRADLYVTHTSDPLLM